MENSRIELYKQRDFGEVFNAAFAFIRQEIKPLGRACLVYLLPVVLLEGILMAIFQSSMMGMLKDSGAMAQGMGRYWVNFMKAYSLLLGAVLLGQTMVFATVVSYLKLYLKDEGEISIPALGNEIKRYFLPMLGAMILFMIVFMVGAVMCVLPGIYLGVSLSVMFYAVVFEGKGIGNAFSRSFQLVHQQWWWTLLLLLVTIVLMYMIVLILQIPASILGFATIFHSAKAQTNPVEAFGTVYIIYTAVVAAIQQIIGIVPVVLLAFHYFNLVEIRDKASLSNKINSIGRDE